MDTLKQWVLLTVVGCLAVLAAGWFLLISPQHAQAADLRTQAAAQDSSNATLRTQISVLKAQAKDLPAQQAAVAEVAAKIPADPGLPALVRALDAASTEAGVELVSITPGTPAPVTASGTTAAPGAAAAPGAPGSAATTGLQVIPVAVNVVGGYFEVEQLVNGLESLNRAFRVTALSLAPGSSPLSKAAVTADDGRTLLATVTGQVYMSTALGHASASTAGAAGPSTGTVSSTAVQPAGAGQPS